MLVDCENKKIPICRQSELLGVSRAAIYYKPVVNPYQLELMRLIDEEYTKHPFYGSRKMTVVLNREGHSVNRKRIQRLMRLMGIEAIYPKPKLSKPHHDHKIYPYLLRNLVIDKVNQVWGTDITYIRLNRGWLYLVAIMDWYSRYILSWELSTSLEADFCIRALQGAFTKGMPDIHNSDQGSQFTCLDYINNLKQMNIRISMDGRGRFMDNIFTERLWRSVKYEEVYIKDYQTVLEAKQGISNYMNFYSDERPHQSLDNMTPAEIYFERKN